MASSGTNRDVWTIRIGNAPANLSIIRAPLNLLRRNGYLSITTAQRFLSHTTDKLFVFVKSNSPALKKEAKTAWFLS